MREVAASMFALMENAVAALMLKLVETGELNAEDGIHKRVLSIHDHWLTEEEAAHDTLSFQLLQSLLEYRFYLAEEGKFVTLFSSLLRNSEAFYFDYRENVILPLESWQTLIAQITAGLREQQHFLFYVHRFRVLLASAFDLNVAVYFLNAQPQAAFEELATIYQLHLLP